MSEDLQQDSKTGGEEINDVMQLISDNAVKYVQPCLVPIYGQRLEPRHTEVQVGTGIRVLHNECTFLVTAKHVLFGHDGTEDASDKCIFAGGGLHQLGYFRPADVYHAFDLAVVRINAFAADPCLPSSCFSEGIEFPNLITMIGFLARGFRRSVQEQRLGNQVRVFTDHRVDFNAGYPALRHIRKRVVDAGSGVRVRAPIPKGMSGGPMLDGVALYHDRISVIGVFTDFVNARSLAFGESSLKVVEMLEQAR